MKKVKLLEYLVTQLFEYGKVKIIDSFFLETYVAHDGNKKYTGQRFVKQFITKLRLAIPDISIVKIEILSETDTTITWQRTFRGTHTKQMQGIPASMKKITWNEIVVTSFEGEKIAEDWLVSNLACAMLVNQ